MTATPTSKPQVTPPPKKPNEQQVKAFSQLLRDNPSGVWQGPINEIKTLYPETFKDVKALSSSEISNFSSTNYDTFLSSNELYKKANKGISMTRKVFLINFVTVATSKVSGLLNC